MANILLLYPRSGNHLVPYLNLKWNKIPSTRKKLLSTVGSTGPHGIHAYCDWIIGCKYKLNTWTDVDFRTGGLLLGGSNLIMMMPNWW